VSYGVHAVECLKSDLGFWREVDGKWVVVYQGENSGPLYLKIFNPEPGGRAVTVRDGWGASGISECTLFDTYAEACEGAQRSSYIMNLLSLARIIQIKIKVEATIDLLEDRPINVLDALAEI